MSARASSWSTPRISLARFAMSLRRSRSVKWLVTLMIEYQLVLGIYTELNVISDHGGAPPPIGIERLSGSVREI